MTLPPPLPPNPPHPPPYLPLPPPPYLPPTSLPYTPPPTPPYLQGRGGRLRAIYENNIESLHILKLSCGPKWMSSMVTIHYILAT